MLKTLRRIVPQRWKNGFHAISALTACAYYRYPARNMQVIGVTGTDGKTTTATMIFQILREAGYRTALVSTIAAYVDDLAIPTGFHTTTPNEWQLQRLLKKFASLDCTHVILEATSIGLDQHRLLGTNISCAVYTNLSHEHLDYHRNLEAYARTKAKLARKAKTAIINRDDQIASYLDKYLPGSLHKLYYSQKNPAAALVKRIFPAAINQQNALAAIATAVAMRISQAEAIQALTRFSGVSGRLEEVANRRGLRIVVDFAHTPNAIKEVLTYLKSEVRPPHRLIAVFGATGRRDTSKRPLMGKVASELADEVILTSDDNYDEDVELIIRQIRSGITRNHGHIHTMPDRRQALVWAVTALSRKGDTIAVLGQGHEQTINLDGKRETPWNDVVQIRKILADKETA